MIKKAPLLTALILSQLVFTNIVFAKKTLADCNIKDQKINKSSRCLDSVKELVDRELQTWVNNHTLNLEEKAVINGRYSLLKIFKRSQSNFITFRDNDCRWQFLMASPENGANLVYKKCYIRLTQSRIKELSQVK